MVQKCVVCGSQVSLNISFHRFPKNPDKRKSWLTACGLTQVGSWSLLCSKHFKEDDFDDTYWPRHILKNDAIPQFNLEIKKDPLDIPGFHRPPPAVIYPPSTCVSPLRIARTVQLPFITNSHGVSSPSFDDAPQIKVESNEPANFESLSFDDVPQVKVECNVPANFEVSNTPVKKSVGVQTSTSTEEYVTSPPPIARYVGDLTPEHFSTPQKAKTHLFMVKEKYMSQQKKIKILRIDKQRLQNRVNKLKALLENVRQKELLSEEACASIGVCLR